MASIYSQNSEQFTGTLIIKELKTKTGTKFNKFLLADRDEESGETTFYTLKFKNVDAPKFKEILNANDREDLIINGRQTLETQEGTEYTTNVIWINSIELL